MATINIQGELVECSRLGEGCFTAGYRRKDNPSIVYLLTMKQESKQERSKEVLAYAKGLRNSKHLPVMIDRGETFYQGETYKVWETRYSLSTSDYTKTPDTLEPPRDSRNLYHAEITQRTNLNELDVDNGVKDALQDIISAVKHFGLTHSHNGRRGSYRFDLHYGNFGVDPQTRALILRDPLVCF